jgi:uncharacterized protein with PIN domain
VKTLCPNCQAELKNWKRNLFSKKLPLSKRIIDMLPKSKCGDCNQKLVMVPEKIIKFIENKTKKKFPPINIGIKK